ncbi:MAG TPA: hypothetical protein VNR89_11865 [Roseomonas sp.]|nr:hypothetical protein [Roseomonas sp.]
MIAIFDRHSGGYLRLVSRAGTITGALKELRRQALLGTDGNVLLAVDQDDYEVFLVSNEDVVAMDAVGPGRARRALDERGRRPL